MYARVNRCAGRQIIVKSYVRRSSSTNYKHVDASRYKPFEDIPGPRSFPLIGTLYKYLPLIGKHRIIVVAAIVVVIVVIVIIVIVVVVVISVVIVIATASV